MAMFDARSLAIDWSAVTAKAESVFGVTAFHSGQQELIEAVLPRLKRAVTA
jgi:hypothetical protein